MLTLLLVLGLAHAHPFTDQRATQAHALQVGIDRVELTYRADVPLAFITTSAPGAGGDPLVAMQRELASGLVLLADGVSLPLQPVGTWPQPVATSEHTVGFTLVLSAHLDHLPRTLQLQTANLQDATNFVSATVDTVDGVRVLDTDLWARTPNGEVARNDRGRWRRDARVLTVELAPPVPGWSWRAARNGPRPAWDARVRTPWEALASGPSTPAVWLGSAGAAAVLGGAAARPQFKTIAALIVAVGLAWVGWPAGSAAWLDGSLALLLLALAIVSVRRVTPWLWTLAAAALVISAQDPIPALGIAVFTTIAMAARPAALPRPWTGAAVVAAWLVLRCVLALMP